MEVAIRHGCFHIIQNLLISKQGGIIFKIDRVMSKFLQFSGGCVKSDNFFWVFDELMEIKMERGLPHNFHIYLEKKLK